VYVVREATLLTYFKFLYLRNVKFFNRLYDITWFGTVYMKSVNCSQPSYTS